MARKSRGKKRYRRREKPMIKVGPMVSGLLAADAGTKLFFGTNLKEFLIGGLGNQPNPQAGGTYSQAITLPELFGYVTSNVATGGVGNYGIVAGSNLGEMVMMNVQQNFLSSAMQFGVSAALPKIMTKTGITRNTNKLLKSFGLSGVIQL